MFKNYMKIAIRNLHLHRGYAAINILGLAIGIAACLLIVLFVKDELSYDKFNTNADRIYRVAVDGLWGSSVIKQTYTNAQLAETLEKECPEVESAVRLYNQGYPVVNYNDKMFTDFRVIGTDPSIFDVFTLPVIQGLSTNTLKDPRSIVLTESTAKAIFGKDNPINRVIKISGENLTISAIIQDLPSNSHFHFNILLNLKLFPYSNDNNWMNNNFITYILLKEHANIKNVESKFQPLLSKNLTWFDNWLKEGNKWNYYLQPLTSIHLKSDLNFELEHNSSMVYVYIFSIIAIFILILASVNFINLTTARASSRYKEIGIRKVVGSSRWSQILQFLTESTVISSMGVAVGVFLMAVLLPWFNNLAGKNLHFNYLVSWYFIAGLVLSGIVIGIVSGGFPAFILSSGKAVNALKSNKNKTAKGSGLREVLVVFQFSISIFLIAGTALVHKQLVYFQQKKLGYDKENILVINCGSQLNKNCELFKNEIQQNPRIISATYTNTTTVGSFMSWVCTPEGKPSTTLNINIVDFDFLKTYKMEMASGRFFSKEYPSDIDGVIINECAAKLFDYKNPIGMRIDLNGRNFTIVGVIKDYNYESMRSSIRPACLLLMDRNVSSVAYISVKVSNNNLPQVINHLKSTWDKHTNGIPFRYSFLDDEYGRLYEGEKRAGTVLIVFSVLAIFIACIGLVGLASYMAAQKTKEIGVRKVNGARVYEVLAMFNKNFVKWVVIAFVIATPVAWYAMLKWLGNFAYKTEMSWWIFALAGLIALGIALLTVSWQSWKAATRNPVEALRYE